MDCRPDLRRSHVAPYPEAGLRLAGAAQRLDGAARAFVGRGDRCRRTLRVGLRADAARLRALAVALWRPVFGLRAVALFEALKGMIVLAAGFGLARAIGGDVGEFAEHLVHRLHLNP